MSAHPELLLNKVALVTGASSGIGEAIAKLLVILGVHVIGFARRGDKLRRVAQSLRGAKGTFDPYPGDVREESDILGAFAYAAANYGGIDILVNDAGIIYNEKITESPTAHYRNVLDTNLLAAAITSREATRSIRQKSGSGYIVNIISINAVEPIQSQLNMGLYRASKFGLHALTEDLRQEMVQTNTSIKVVGIYPGIVQTQLMSKGGFPPIRNVPALQPADVADLVVYATTRPGNVQINELVVEPRNAVYP